MFGSFATAIVTAYHCVTLLFGGATEASPPQTTDTPEDQFWKLYRQAAPEDRRSMSIPKEGGGLTMKYAATDPRTGITYTLTKNYR